MSKRQHEVFSQANSGRRMPQVASTIIAEYAGHMALDTTRLYIHMSGRDISAVVASRMEDLDAWIAAALKEVDG